MIIDVIFAILVVIAIIKGFRKGLIIALFSLLAFIVGLAAALKLSAFVALHLKDSINLSAKWLPFISFIIVFITVVILVKLGARLIEKFAEMTMLGWANKLGGILLFALLYTLIFSVFLFYADKIHLINTNTLAASQTYPFIKPLGPVAIDGFGKIIPVFKDMFTQLEDFFASLPEKAS